MIRSLLYVLILCIVVFIPFSLPQKTEKKNFKRASNSISVKIVEPQPLVEKVVTHIIAKPKPKPKKIIKKKVLKKKIIKKKVMPKTLPVPKPKEEMVELKEELVKVEESIVEEEVVQRQTTQTSSASRVDEYYALIYEEINKNKYYPKKSKKFKQEDTIGVSFIIDKDGRVSAFKILKESQYRELNKAVKKMFKKMREFEKPPSGVQTPLEMSIEINFKLQR